MGKDRERTSEIISIDEALQDPKNANMGTERGREALPKSISAHGAGRSVLLDKNGKAIAGNKTLLAAKEAGVAEIVVVRSSGERIVAHLREDLDLEDPDDPSARLLAYADNQIGRVSLEFDALVIQEDIELGLDLSSLFTEEELSFFSEDLLPPDDFASYGEDIETSHSCPKCGYQWSESK